MKNTWISLLVVLSIALQSFASVANSNESHQIDSLHIQTEHSHDSDDIELFDESSDTEHNIKDCHHCGHCQGTHTQWVARNKSTLQTPKLIITNQYFYADHVDKIFTEEPIRPPIV
ncbi:DUF2946 domain-containing protein [Paraglaciecola chathamensis]|jgi:hypothetical protein|uniref:DUF2946 domain-containing protein n=1 Tax=Paraglaciecola chathamensis TaxID=368405 RepID=A0A8H9IFF6_9ALTE|nr:DUF2946 domain-containing protein [Paraglaciecola oceanifecundans]GGZ84445.1 hypothetical protein GCM10011274_47350 [Paraglaciecola oceanifecundans]|tara:strand:- start:3663 stop:4010 length:348 start_codon:yes stop_codon:yes gene_type:complete